MKKSCSSYSIEVNNYKSDILKGNLTSILSYPKLPLLKNRKGKIG